MQENRSVDEVDLSAFNLSDRMREAARVMRETFLAQRRYEGEVRAFEGLIAEPMRELLTDKIRRLKQNPKLVLPELKRLIGQRQLDYPCEALAVRFRTGRDRIEGIRGDRSRGVAIADFNERDLRVYVTIAGPYWADLLNRRSIKSVPGLSEQIAQLDLLGKLTLAVEHSELAPDASFADYSQGYRRIEGGSCDSALIGQVAGWGYKIRF